MLILICFDLIFISDVGRFGDWIGVWRFEGSGSAGARRTLIEVLMGTASAANVGYRDVADGGLCGVESELDAISRFGYEMH